MIFQLENLQDHAETEIHTTFVHTIQHLCALKFLIVDIGVMRVISSVSTDNLGQIFGLVCSVDIFNDIEDLGVPPPTFEWFFGPRVNGDMLPSGVAVSTVARNGTTYTSTLFFTPPKVFHAGTYTCRLGGNPRMEANATITVNTVGGILSRAAPPDTTPELELLHCVIALCSIILLVALASAIVIIGLLCSIMR